MGNNGPREHWRRLLLPLGISMAINLILCGALVHLSAAPPERETTIAVELDGVHPAPPPPPPQPLIERIFAPPPKTTPEKPPVKPEEPPVKEEKPAPTLFNRITQIFQRDDPPAPEEPPATQELPAPKEPPTPVEPEKVTAVAPVPVPVAPAPVNPPAPTPNPVPPNKAQEDPIKIASGPPAAANPGGTSGGSIKHSTALPSGAGPGTDGGKGPGGIGHDPGITLGAGGTPGGSTNNTGPGVSSGTGSGPGTTGSGAGTGPDKAPGGKDPGTGAGKEPGNGSTGSGEAAHGSSRGARVVSQSPPAYPAGAREEGVEGTVQLLVSLDAAGKITGTKVQRSSGDRRLDRAAEKEIRKWTFEAKMEDGTAVPSTLKVNVVFQLE